MLWEGLVPGLCGTGASPVRAQAKACGYQTIYSNAINLERSTANQNKDSRGRLSYIFLWPCFAPLREILFRFKSLD